VKTYFLTIVLDGMPWLPCVYAALLKLSFAWEWHIAEGAAMPIGCTSWCKPQDARLSQDGTHEFLKAVGSDPRVKVCSETSWPGKVAMFNRLLSNIAELCLVWQIDSDELWSPGQIECARHLMCHEREKHAAFFRCRYYVGAGIRTTSTEGYGNHSAYEWRRLWRFEPGMRFQSHEPPVWQHDPALKLPHLDQQYTASLGLVFDHMAWVTEAQARYKCAFYGYGEEGLKGWLKLQANQTWPVQLGAFLPWVKDQTTALRGVL